MIRILRSVKYHWGAVILAVIFGALMILPFIYFQIKLGSDFRGIFPEIVNDSNFYYARIKDVIDGHPFLGNAYLLEHKDELLQSVFLAEYLLAQPLKLFGIGINTARLIYNFLLPAIAFILAYSAFYLILKKRSWALMFSSFLFFGLFLLSFIRPISPQFNFIFWLTQFIFLWLLLKKPDSKKLLVLNALNFGLLFYIYPYYWTFYLILFGLLSAAYFFRGRPLAYAILKITAGGLVLTIPYFYLNYLSSKLPYYTETLTRLGLIYTRFPSGIRIIFWSAMGLATFSWFLYRKIINWNEKTLFFITGILASIIAVNQHLITGRNLEFSSHYSMSAMFFLVFALTYLVSQYNTNKQVYFKMIFGIIILVSIIWGVSDYSQRVFAIDENAVYRQNYVAIFNWLNKNTEKDSVVYANADLSRLIPVYTANNVYYIREANLFFISDEEVLDRFIINNFFGKFNKDFIIENVRSVYGVRYIDAYGHAVQANKLHRLFGLKTEPEVYLPEDAVQKVLSRAKELQSSDFIRELNQYKVDYLIWDKNKNPDWKINFNNLNPVFQNGNLIIFKFIPPNS